MCILFQESLSTCVVAIQLPHSGPPSLTVFTPVPTSASTLEGIIKDTSLPALSLFPLPAHAGDCKKSKAGPPDRGLTSFQKMLLQKKRKRGEKAGTLIPSSIVGSAFWQVEEKVWKAFCDALRTSVKLSFRCHLQSHSQTERANQSPESTLQCVTAQHPASCSSILTLGWVHPQLVGLHSQKGLSPFIASLGYQPYCLSTRKRTFQCSLCRPTCVAAGVRGSRFTPCSYIRPNAPGGRPIIGSSAHRFPPIAPARGPGFPREISPSRLTHRNSLLVLWGLLRLMVWWMPSLYALSCPRPSTSTAHSTSRRWSQSQNWSWSLCLSPSTPLVIGGDQGGGDWQHFLPALICFWLFPGICVPALWSITTSFLNFK